MPRYVPYEMSLEEVHRAMNQLQSDYQKGLVPEDEYMEYRLQLETMLAVLEGDTEQVEQELKQ